MLDTNDLFFDGKIECTFIEPNPERLLSLLRDNDQRRHRIIKQGIQEVGLECFAELAAGDILFVDSSHVSKVHSDVNWIFFKILPALRAGVTVHFHDVFAGFEYPKEWVFEGGPGTRITCFGRSCSTTTPFRCSSSTISSFLRPLKRDMPLCQPRIWLKKIA